MNTTAKQTRNEYYKQYRAKNKDKIKAINNTYWNKRASLVTAEEQPEQREGSTNG